MSVTLDVVGIAVRDMAASLGFYRLLGVPVPEGAESGGHAEVDLGGFRLAWDTVELLREVYGGWGEPSGRRVELAFRCESSDGVDEAYARMTGHGYEGRREPWDASWGQRYAVVGDPDGNLISLYA